MRCEQMTADTYIGGRNITELMAIVIPAAAWILACHGSRRSWGMVR